MPINWEKAKQSAKVYDNQQATAAKKTSGSLPSAQKQTKPLTTPLDFRAAEQKNMAQNKPKPDANFGALSMQAFRAADKKNLADNPTLQPSTLPGVGISFLPDTSLAQSNDKTAKTNVALSNASQKAGNLTPLEQVALSIQGGVKSGFGGAANSAETSKKWLYNKVLGGQYTPEQIDNIVNNYGVSNLNPITYEKEQIVTPDKILESAQKDSAKSVEGTSGIGKFALEGVGSAANMATGFALSKLTGIPFVATMGVQAGGSSAYDAKQQGKTLDQQMAYGLTTGISTGLIESIGGIGASQIAKNAAKKVAGNVLSKLPGNIATWANSTGAKIAGKVIADAISEGGEEALQYSTDIILQKLTLNNDVPFDIKQMAYQALQGGVIGGLFGGATSIASAISTPNPILNNDSTITNNATAPQNAPQSTPVLSEIFYVGNAEVIKNPTQQEAYQIESEAAKEHPDLVKLGEPLTRKAYDSLGNVYLWKAYDATHQNVAGYLSKNNVQISQNAPQSTIAPPLSGIATEQTNAPQSNVEALKPYDGLGAADAGFDPTGNKLQDMITDYGAIKPGKGNITTERIVELPKQTSPDKNVMQTMRTIMEAPVVTNGTAEVLEKMVVDEKFSRFVNTDKMALEAARTKILDEGYAESLRKFSKAMSKGSVTKNNVALGFTLLNAAESVGDSKTSVEIITDMVDNIRDAAQTLQAVKILKKMQPEYQLYAVQRSVNNFKAELEQRYGDRAPKLSIDENLAQAYLDALFAKDDAKAKSAMDDIYRNIASQVPATFADKWDAWRYTAMLFNPVTHIKNIVGNYVFRAERFVKSVISASAQSAAKNLGAQFEATRSILTKKDSALIKEAQDYYAKDVEAILRYGKYDDATNKINEYRKIYGQGGRTKLGNLTSNTLGKGAEWARKTNTELLSTEDNWVSKPAYVKSLASYLKANGVNFQTAEPPMLDRARAFAILEAQKSSYRDSNAFSDFIANNTRYRGKNIIGKGWNVLSEGVIPFRRTPANILVRGLEYSPVGLAKSATVDVGKLVISKKFPELAKKLNMKEMTPTELLDNLSEGLTGTALTALGMLLASWGLISVGTSGDDKTDKFEDTQGKQNFALTIGNSTYTIDWLAPAAMPLFMGVSIYDKLTDKSTDGVTLKDALKVASDISDPLLETSMLETLNNYLEGFGRAAQQDENLLWYGFTQAALSYLGQSVPSIGGRINRTFDATRRTVFTDPKSGIPTDLQYFMKSQLNKIPGGSFANEPFVDQWGRTVETGPSTRLVQNWLSPGYVKPINTSAMETELQRLYTDYAKEREINVLPPATVRKYFSNNGDDVYMTAEEYTQYKKTFGQYAYTEQTKLTSSAEYRGLSDEKKTEKVMDVWEAAAEKAKTEVMEKRGEMRLPSVSDGEKLSTYIDVGLSEKQAYTLYKALDPLKATDTETLKYQKVSEVIKQSLTPQQKTAIVASFFTEHDKDGNVTSESLLPYLTGAPQLISAYKTSKDPSTVSMSVPSEFTLKKVDYTLTDAEKKIFKDAYVKLFNQYFDSTYSEKQIGKLRDKALEAAKYAVYQSRQ